MDPTRIIFVQDYSQPTLRAVTAQLERSTNVDHLVYRESELDALWSLLELALRTARRDGANDEQMQHLQRLFAAARAAHDLVAAEDAAGAAAALREVLEA